MNATIAYLKSERFVFTALLFVLVGQVVNFAHIFSAANPKLTADAPTVAVWLYAGICTIGLEMAILVSVLNGKRTVAALFAAGFLCINLCWNYQVWADPLPVAVAKSLIYVMLSVTIWFFSDLFGQKIEAKASEAKANEANEAKANGANVANGANANVAKAKANVANGANASEANGANASEANGANVAKAKASEANAMLLEVANGSYPANGRAYGQIGVPVADQANLPHSCTVCDQRFATVQALNAHSRKHRPS